MGNTTELNNIQEQKGTMFTSGFMASAKESEKPSDLVAEKMKDIYSRTTKKGKESLVGDIRYVYQCLVTDNSFKQVAFAKVINEQSNFQSANGSKNDTLENVNKDVLLQLTSNLGLCIWDYIDSNVKGDRENTGLAKLHFSITNLTTKLGLNDSTENYNISGIEITQDVLFSLIIEIIGLTTRKYFAENMVDDDIEQKEILLTQLSLMLYGYFPDHMHELMDASDIIDGVITASPTSHSEIHNNQVLKLQNGKLSEIIQKLTEEKAKMAHRIIELETTEDTEKEPAIEYTNITKLLSKMEDKNL